MAIKDIISGLFRKKNKQMEITSDYEAVINGEKTISTASCFDTSKCITVEINYDEFNADSISSVCKYAILKYGENICNNPNRFRNVLTDLSPRLSKEIKLLSCLCNSGNFRKLLILQEAGIADLMLWVNNASDYLVRDELIDELVAYEFCVGLVKDIIGKDIPTNYLDKKKAERNQQAEELIRKQQAEKAAETRRRNQERAKKRKLEEMKKRLAEEEQARFIAEEQLEKERQVFFDIQKQTEEATNKELESLHALLKQYENSQNDIHVDYDEQTSILELFTRYNGRIAGNIIVVEIGWSGDFCFVVDEIVQKQGLKAQGTLYKDGEFYRNYTYPAEQFVYKMYSGSSRAKINTVHTRRSTDFEAKVIHKASPMSHKVDNILVMPAGVGEYTSIEKIKAANPGKRIIVVKEGWSNDYCFCVEGFEGQVKAVGTRFLDGKPRSEDWVDRRHRKFKVYNGPSKEKIEEYYQYIVRNQ